MSYTKTMLALAGALASTTAEQVSYHDHLVLRCLPTTPFQLSQLHEMAESEEAGLDFWLEPRRTGGPVDIMVSQSGRQNLENTMEKLGIPCAVMMEDVGAEMEAQELQRKILRASNATGTDAFFTDYHEWTEVQAYMDSLASEFPDMAAVSEIGRTYEDRPIKIITLSTAPGTGKPALWFDGGLHAREWVTVSTVSYIADTLLRQYGVQEDATFMLDNYDIRICPIVNVDGYDYTWTGDRNWRKTRAPNDNSPCVGTDPNRNWAFHWGEAGASPQPCSDSYQGAAPADQVETATLQEYICDHKDTLKGYINFHSYSQLWMSPWGYTDELPPDYEDQNALSEAAVKAIKDTHGKTYDYGTISNIIYPSSGSSADYTYGVCGIKYSYGAELRDTGRYGFLLPPDQIIPTGEEIYNAVVTMGRFIKENP